MNSSASRALHSNQSFGPVEEDRYDFDFSLVFQESVLSIVPSVLLLVIAPFRLLALSERRKRIGGRLFRSLKLLAIAVYGALQIALLILWSISPEPTTRTSIISATLAFANAILFCMLSFMEHSRSLRPSPLLSIYLIFSILFDAVRVRTLWLVGYDPSIRDLFTASLAMKVFILGMEAKGKRRYFSDADRDLGPEESSGVFSQSFFLWLNALIQQGFKKVLSPTDLYPIDEKMNSEALAASFWQRWLASPKSGKNSLLIALFKHFKWHLLVPVLPRLILIAVTFCQPLLINRFLSFLQHPDQNKNIGYGLVAAYGLVYFTIAVSTGFYWHRTYHGITLVRGSLVSTIYRKTTELSIMTSNSSAAVSLMSTDIERIVNGHRNLHEVWANVISVCIATWLLQTELGLVCLAPILLAAVCFCGAVSLSGPAQKRQGKWMKKLEKRVGVTATMLSSIKGIKLTGLTLKQFSLVQGLRLDEIDSAAAFRMVTVATATIAFTPLQISPLVTFGTFVGIQSSEHKPLDAARMFTSLTLLILLNSPLSQLFQSIPDLFAAVNCIRRIQDYLNADSRNDYRSAKLSSPSSATPHDSSDESHILAHSATDDIELKHMTIAAGKPTTSNTEGTEAISVRQGAFGWGRDAEHIVRDIDLSLKRSTLTMVIGPVASGKTTLVKALLGEVSILRGSVQLATLDIAYCDQHAWLVNASLQRNILGFANFDGPWYRSVTRACALDKDIATLPNGDRTLIGSGGITLSGGQKQRVAVARAVYARKHIMIFDDVFAGFDNETTKWVSDHLFGPRGLLRAQGTTVIFVTHAVDLLPSADYIVALGNDGRIREQGTFEELNVAEGYVHGFSIEASREKTVPADVGDQENDAEEHLILQRQKSIVTDIPDDGSRQKGDSSTYSYYFKAIGWRYTVIFALLLLIENIFKTFAPIWLKWWSDFPEQVGKYLGVYAALQIMSLILLALVVWHSLNKMVVKSGKQLHSILLSTVLNAPMSFFSSTDTGTTTNRFSQDMELVDGQLPGALLNTVSILLLCIGYSALTAAASLWIALSFPGVIFIFYVVQKYYLRTSRQLRFMDLEAKSPLYTQFIESLGGLATIRAFGWENDSQVHNNELLDSSQQPFYLLFMIQRWLTLVLDLVAMGLALIVVGLAFKTRATVSAGFTGVSLTNIISLAEYAKYLVLNWTELETSIGAVSRIKSFEATTLSEHLLSENDTTPQLWPRNGLVEFREVSAAYNADSDSNALSDLSLTINPGEKVGLCGRSGSGKSSLVLALFRMIELNHGSIHIDGIDISTLQRNEVRSRLNAIPQDAYFFAGTVRLNLDPWETQSDDAIRDVLAKVELLHTIEDSCGGLDADMDVNLLSQGQHQLFCLARATLRPGKIVVLDEVTSSVDRRTDDLMQRIIRTEFADRTIIAIAHRLETIVDFDKIAVLDKGVLIEYGSPAELLSKRSHFRNLYEMYKTKTADEDEMGQRKDDEEH